MEEPVQESEVTPMSVDGQPAEESKAEEVPVVSAEERLWGVVKANPADFTSWTELIQETEKTDDIVKIRICYDAFLEEFPLCYGYWKKYADFEARFSTSQEILEVYERAVKAVAHSVDIWIHYCTYVADKFEFEEVIRLFERAVSCVGTDYLSYNLWEKYLDYAKSQLDWCLFFQLHTRIMDIPLQQLDRVSNNFKQHMHNRVWMDVKSFDRDDKRHFRNEGLPKDADEVEKYLAYREALCKKTKEWDAKIREFEITIRRPYFHVKALDDAQLGNWHRYLDFLEKEGDMQKVIKLFERCLIACANYPEYWIRFVEYLEKQNSLELANDALHRATTIFVKRLTEIHLFAARFKERTNDIDGARQKYRYIVTELVPGHLEGVVKFAHFEKRQNDIDGACSVFESAIESEKAKQDSRTLPSIYVQYVQFLDRVGRLTKAMEVLATALQELPYSKLVVETAIHYEYTTKSKQLDQINTIIKKATQAEGNTLSQTDREELSSIYLEFIDSFGDVNSIVEAESRHENLFPFRKSYIEYRRRLAHDSTFGDRAAKKSTSPAATQAYGTQWAGYSAQGYQQNWQQTTPAQWTGYSQQPGYSYGSYYTAQAGQAATYTAAYGSQDMNGWNGSATTGSW